MSKKGDGKNGATGPNLEETLSRAFNEEWNKKTDKQKEDFFKKLDKQSDQVKNKFYQDIGSETNIYNKDTNQIDINNKNHFFLDNSDRQKQNDMMLGISRIQEAEDKKNAKALYDATNILYGNVDDVVKGRQHLNKISRKNNRNAVTEQVNYTEQEVKKEGKFKRLINRIKDAFSKTDKSKKPDVSANLENEKKVDLIDQIEEIEGQEGPIIQSRVGRVAKKELDSQVLNSLDLSGYSNNRISAESKTAENSQSPKTQAYTNVPIDGSLKRDSVYSNRSSSIASIDQVELQRTNTNGSKVPVSNRASKNSVQSQGSGGRQ